MDWVQNDGEDQSTAVVEELVSLKELTQEPASGEGDLNTSASSAQRLWAWKACCQVLLHCCVWWSVSHFLLMLLRNVNILSVCAACCNFSLCLWVVVLFITPPALSAPTVPTYFRSVDLIWMGSASFSQHLLSVISVSSEKHLKYQEDQANLGNGNSSVLIREPFSDCPITPHSCSNYRD